MEQKEQVDFLRLRPSTGRGMTSDSFYSETILSPSLS